VRILPAGPRALLVELSGRDEAEALHAEIARRMAAGTFPPVEDVVPAARTILLDGLAHPSALAAELPGWRFPPAQAAHERLVEVPVTYDGGGSGRGGPPLGHERARGDLYAHVCVPSGGVLRLRSRIRLPVGAAG
jgi:allophanate hydrolase subunit 1